MKSNTSSRQGERVLLAITALWGTTFLAIQDALDNWPPYFVMATRFGIAAMVLLPLALRQSQKRPFRPWPLRDGLIVGIFAFTGFALQTVSLQYTTQAHCAFGTSLVTVFVPPLGTVLWRTPWRISTTVGLLAASIGAVLLLGSDLEPGVRMGDFLAVAGAASFAGQVTMLGIYAKRAPLLPLVAVEVTVVTLLSGITLLATGEQVPADLAHWELLVYLGLIATALCMLGQVWGQARTSSTRAAFVYALEPIFAAAFAWTLRNESMTPTELVGAGLMVLAAVTADRATPRWLRKAAATVRPTAKKYEPPQPPAGGSPDARDGRPSARRTADYG